MTRRFLPSLLAMVALGTCLYSSASPAQNAQSGTITDGDFITVPSGTTNDWALLVAPREMGFEEPGSERDNALLRIECYAVPINAYTWRVVARFKMRPWNNADGYWNAGSASYVLVHK
ncbi:hypothetical protein JGU66_23415 [Myxococcaceae bacterium JPH2]|nr:hypothetical protein [Myxococcaceae bacterium JPH2]